MSDSCHPQMSLQIYQKSKIEEKVEREGAKGKGEDMGEEWGY